MKTSGLLLLILSSTASIISVSTFRPPILSCPQTWKILIWKRNPCQNSPFPLRHPTHLLISTSLLPNSNPKPNCLLLPSPSLSLVDHSSTLPNLSFSSLENFVGSYLITDHAMLVLLYLYPDDIFKSHALLASVTASLPSIRDKDICSTPLPSSLPSGT